MSYSEIESVGILQLWRERRHRVTDDGPPKWQEDNLHSHVARRSEGVDSLKAIHL